MLTHEFAACSIFIINHWFNSQKNCNISKMTKLPTTKICHYAILLDMADGYWASSISDNPSGHHHNKMTKNVKCLLNA